MSRIRTVKPEFFRHELLQELEMLHPGQHVMLTFAGLWTQADSKGRFRDKPRVLKLDILPFIDFDISKTLDILASHGFIQRYEVEGEQYGQVIAFETHQRITGKEATDGEKYPGIDGETSGKQPGNNQLPRKGRERKRKGYTVNFEKFWSEYPNKVKKGAASDVWNRDELDERIDGILTALASYKRTSQWASENGKYIPHPTTWLNGRCYDDQPTGAVAQKTESDYLRPFK